MEKYHAYLDECGGYGFHDSVLEQERMFIVAAAIIKESDIEVVNSALSNISQEDFGGQEIKSNRIKGNHSRRIRVLNKVIKLPFNIVTDEVGNPEFADEFAKYVRLHRKPVTLFDNEEFDVVNSKYVNAVQLADLVAGTLSYVYEDSKRDTVPEDIDYLKILEKKLLRIKFFPKSYDELLFFKTIYFN